MGYFKSEHSSLIGDEFNYNFSLKKYSTINDFPITNTTSTTNTLPITNTTSITHTHTFNSIFTPYR